MKRDLEKWRAEGEKMLEENARYDLTAAEVRQIMEGLNIEPSEGYWLMNRALDVGIAIGARIRQAR